MLRSALLLASALILSGTAVAHAQHDHAAAGGAMTAAMRAQLDELAAAVRRYGDIELARREGWKPFGGDEPLMGQHWYNPAGPDYVGHDVRLDFNRPSLLMYSEVGGRMVLTGVAYTVRLRSGEAPPEGFAGTADRWHVHDFAKAVAAATETRPLLRWLANMWLDANYRRHGDDRARVSMVHAWVTLPNPDGVFADFNRTLPYLKLGLPVEWSRGASVEAARGLDLATRNGCAEVADGRLWIAAASDGQKRAIRAACDQEAAAVRGALGQGPAAANAAGEMAWWRFDALWTRMLTPEQRDRVAAMGEHGPHATEASGRMGTGHAH